MYNIEAFAESLDKVLPNDSSNYELIVQKHTTICSNAPHFTRLTLDLPQYMNDVSEVIRSFAPFITIDTDSNNYINLRVTSNEDTLTVSIESELSSVSSEHRITGKDLLEQKKFNKRFVKNFLYRYCSNLTSIELPYGSLTGVRPTKLVYDIIKEKSIEMSDVKTYLIENFYLKDDRAQLVLDTVRGQSGIREYGGVDIFINIPFCKSRCKYCSFLSTELDKIIKLIPQYVKTLRLEIDSILRVINEYSLTVKSIYVGGGTPTVLSTKDLEYLLTGLKTYTSEFTIEAGRPDSIERDTLALLSELGVTRISINPQTFNDETLINLHRGHTVLDVIEKYAMAKEFDFDINMDLIAGLPGDGFKDFKHSIDQCIRLSPQNITVHSFSLKRGSSLRNDGMVKEMSGLAMQSMNYAIEALKRADFQPYYMYRQKNTIDNLENIGFTKKSKACIYNIDYMEDTTSVFAAGAGAMSKFVSRVNNRIERFHNSKGINEYLERYNDSLNRIEKLGHLIKNEQTLFNSEN
ncbi:MAG: coproporphyrinogen dehydrogenase HemZ [Christensenellaceae bacterium]|jgi:oxygen-independent coproporphyrinogen-3 oxidase|nr:coproporphyrinogen dehydrogenase HemZ [Christensenellaceae bacterium]